MSVCVNPVAVILENHSFGYRNDVKSLFFHTFLSLKVWGFVVVPIYPVYPEIVDFCGFCTENPV